MSKTPETDTETEADAKAPNVVTKKPKRDLIAVIVAAIATVIIGSGGFNASSKIEAKLDTVLAEVTGMKIEVAGIKADVGALKAQDLGRRVHEIERAVDRIELKQGAPK